jgi:TctA family transporter
MLDVNRRRALIRTDADLAPFVTRPIPLILAVITALTLLSRAAWFRRLLGAGATRARAAAARDRTRG